MFNQQYNNHSLALVKNVRGNTEHTAFSSGVLGVCQRLQLFPTSQTLDQGTEKGKGNQTNNDYSLRQTIKRRGRQDEKPADLLRLCRAPGLPLFVPFVLNVSTTFL